MFFFTSKVIVSIMKRKNPRGCFRIEFFWESSLIIFGDVEEFTKTIGTCTCCENHLFLVFQLCMELRR